MNEKPVTTDGNLKSNAAATTSVTTAAQTVATKARDVAEGVASTQFASFSSQQMSRATGTLSSVASALRHTGSQLREQDQGAIATYLDKASLQIERVSSHLDNKDLGEIMHEVEVYARREPAIFLGGAFVLGLIGARFLKSSSRQQSFSNNTASDRPPTASSNSASFRQPRPEVPLAGAEGTTGVMYGSPSPGGTFAKQSDGIQGAKGAFGSGNNSNPGISSTSPSQPFNKGRG